jgi:hypothetical protein
MEAEGGREKRMERNPNLPAVDPNSRGVGNAVVFLRGGNAEQSRPWDLAPLRVEIRDRQFHVLQGGRDARVGFARTGDAIEIVSKDSVFHSVHASGAAFFTVPFPDPDDPSRRVLDRKGVVELTSATAQYAMRAYLFVDDCPYYAATDTEGKFVLQKVPPGQYEIVCWMASWQPARLEQDPETAITSRLFFRSALQIVQPLTIAPRSTQEISFSVSGNGSH